MARLIDADKILEKLQRMIEYCKKDKYVNGLTALFQVGDAIMDCPTVDAVPVVRCRDCVYFNAKNSLETQGICMCGEKEMNYGGEFYPFADDFCSYGERKKE